MTEKAYIVTHTQSTVYIDKLNKAVSGYLVEFDIVAFNESHTVNVPSLDPKIVQTEIEKVIKQREALANLG